LVWGDIRLNGIIQKKRENRKGGWWCVNCFFHNNFLFIGVVVPCCYHQKVKKNGTSEGEINPLGIRNSSPLRRMLKNALTLSFVHRIKRTFPPGICTRRTEKREGKEKNKEEWSLVLSLWDVRTTN